MRARGTGATAGPVTRSRAGGPAGRGPAVAVPACVAVLVALLLIGLGAEVAGLFDDAVVAPAQRPGDGTSGNPARSELELVTRPMPGLPAQASQPHALSSATAGPPLEIPVATRVAGRLVPDGYPATPEGAIGQLAALTRVGLDGGDPDVYDATYASVGQEGAPPAAASYLHGQLAALRRHAQLGGSGPVPGLTITWTSTSALVKGSASGGSLVVVCVLGQMDVDYQGRQASGGLGDCQALRRVAGQWRIASGPPAAAAASAWPGSQEAVAAGYREVH